MTSSSNGNEQTEIVTADNIIALYRAGRRNFRGADLAGATLTGADLTGADLRGADLAGATLTGADLRGATLRGANLRGADLWDANLRGADLTGADLTGADLTDATLRGADLRGADLTGATLTGATLTGADLTCEQLESANTADIQADLYGYLEHVPGEVAGLLATLEAGGIDGSTYEGPCACLAGTCERLLGEREAEAAEAVGALIDLREVDSPRERWFLAIRPGDTPETNAVAAITAEWLRAWIEAHAEAGA